MEHWCGSDWEIYRISGLGNCNVISASDYLTELGGRKGYAKQGKVYGDGQFYWESREERKNFYKLGWLFAGVQQRDQRLSGS